MANGWDSTAAYANRMYELRYFGLSLVRSDLHNRYRRSFLGIAWSLARPIGMTLVLCVVFSTLFNVGLREYAPFLFLGIAVWQFLIESIQLGCSCFISSAAYIKQQKVPLALFPLRTVLGTGFHGGIAMLIAILLTFVLQGVPAPGVFLSFVPGLILVFLLGLACATIFGILHTYFPDTQHGTDILMQIVYYLTPIMYKPDAFKSRAQVARLIQYNPLTSVLELVRRPLLSGEYPDPYHVMVASCFVATLLILAWALLKKFERNLVFWV